MRIVRIQNYESFEVFHLDIISQHLGLMIDISLITLYIMICTFTNFVLFSDNSCVETGIETKRSAGSQTRLVGEDNSIFQNIWIPSADRPETSINIYYISL